MGAVQMNTRIDGDLKAEGDAVFAELGYSPSEAVRLVWGFAARNKHDRQKLSDMLRLLKDPRKAQAEQKAAKQRQEETTHWLDEWDASWQGFFDTTGCDSAQYRPLDSKEIEAALGQILDEEQERNRLGLSREDYDRVLFERWRAES